MLIVIKKTLVYLKYNIIESDLIRFNNNITWLVIIINHFIIHTSQYMVLPCQI